MKDKLILVTGGAGFVGSNLIQRLVRDGNRVIALDNYFAGNKEAHIGSVEYREGHTKDIERLVSETPDLIYHLGEYSRVEQSILEPDLVHDLNVVGTRGVLDFWRKKKCKLVYAGSSTKFGDGGMARTATPYAASKAANTELVKEIGDAEHLPYAITYFYNVFGLGERADTYGTVIEMFKQMYLRGAPIAVTLPGTQERNFTHVDDIVDGLVLIGERGQGDEYGLGNEKTFTMIEAARLFGDTIVMLPERAGNRLSSGLDTTKVRSLGWEAHRKLEDYVQEFLNAHPQKEQLEKRVLVFSTTFFPVSGPAEDALCDLMRAMPSVTFDIVTTAFSKGTPYAAPVSNAVVHRVGSGTRFDKYLLPVFGFLKARQLHRKHSYLFAWALMASYAALASLFFKWATGTPLLITLADQDLSVVSPLRMFIMRALFSDADQIYGVSLAQEKYAKRIAQKKVLRHSMGGGDAFANQIRFTYAGFLCERLTKIAEKKVAL